MLGFAHFRIPSLFIIWPGRRRQEHHDPSEKTHLGTTPDSASSSSSAAAAAPTSYVPQHARASFLRTATSRRMRRANDILAWVVGHWTRYREREHGREVVRAAIWDFVIWAQLRYLPRLVIRLCKAPVDMWARG
ncbi:hypothetical protein F4779DRAFT_619395 [Xylariaceae sp. FL0662B]|nr:hypothetical protein F4779DRAFT_619395 [Xylariaceae sp. FL0662B]